MLNSWLRNLSTDFTLKNCLIGSVKLTRNTDPDKYVLDIGVQLNLCSEFSLPDGNMGKNVIIFGADTSSSVHMDNNYKDI